mgnify:FL=1
MEIQFKDIKKKGHLHHKTFENFMIAAIILAGVLIIFNQMQLSAISSSLDSLTGTASKSIFFGFCSKNSDLSKVYVS